MIFIRFLFAALLIVSCKSNLTVMGSFAGGSRTLLPEFSPIDPIELQEGSSFLSPAFLCKGPQSNRYSPRFIVRTISDADVNCSVAGDAGDQLSCKPQEKLGSENWLASLEICCLMAEAEVCQSVTTAVFDKGYDRSNPSSITVRDSEVKSVYTLGDVLQLSLEFPAPVTVGGEPIVDLRLDTGTQQAIYASGSGSSVLNFSYTVEAGDEASVLDYTSALALQGGELTDALGLAIDRRLPTAGTSGSLSQLTPLAIDAKPPTAPASVGFSSVVSAGNSVLVAWQNGADTRFKTHHVKLCSSHACSESCQEEGASVSSPLTLSSPEGVFYACVQSEDELGLKSAWVSSLNTIAVDNSMPSVSEVSSTAGNGYFAAGTTIPLQVIFSEPVLVRNGSELRLKLSNGALVSYASGSGTATLNFSYTVQDGEDSLDLDYFSVSALEKGGSSVTDLAGNGASLTLPVQGTPNSLAGGHDLIVDTTDPQPPTTVVHEGGTRVPGSRGEVRFTPGTDAHYREAQGKYCTNSNCETGCGSEAALNEDNATLSGAVLGSHVYACVRSVDEAGNTSAWIPTPSTAEVLSQAVKRLAASSADLNSNCAIIQDDSLRCWGNYAQGALGVPATENLLAPSDTPVDFGSGLFAVEVAIGHDHACARLNDGSMRCWGGNNDGRLGYSDNINRTVPNPNPIYLGPGKTAKRIAVAPRQTCALLNDNTAKCWGFGEGGVLGLGDASSRYSPQPDPIDFGGRVPVSIHPSYVHVCALFEDKTISCWGENHSMMLGYGNTGNRTVPGPAVPVGGDVLQLALTDRATCVRLSNGTVKCWGFNDDSRLGYDDLLVREDPSVADVLDFGVGRTVKDLQGGYNHLCAILDNDSLSCWGHNSYGAVGDSSLRWVPKPMPVDLGARTVRQVQTHVNGTCVLLDNYMMKCWGEAIHGLHGLGKSPFSKAPFQPNVNTAVSFKKIAVSVGAACGIVQDDSLRCWGDDFWQLLGGGLRKIIRPAQAVVHTFPVGVPIDITMGREHTCVLLNNNQVQCWGNGWEGRLGYTSLDWKSAPDFINIPLPGGVVPYAISAGLFHTCILANLTAGAGDVHCWGWGASGRLGLGNEVSYWEVRPNAVDLGGGAKAQKVVGGHEHTCALLDNGNVKCWGNNQYGQLGIGAAANQTSPGVAVDLGVGRTATDIAAYNSSSCAILDNGTLKCWGRNDVGQLGIGSFVDSNIPVLVNLGVGSSAFSLYSGYDNVCVKLDDGSIKCWGPNDEGEVGLPLLNRVTSPFINPNYYGLGKTVKTLSIGERQSCSILNDDTLRCSGVDVETIADSIPGALNINFWAGPRVLKLSGEFRDVVINPGDNVNVTVKFSQPVQVIDDPALGIWFETGGADALATYVSGSGSDTLIFRFVSQAGYATSTLSPIAVSPFQLGGGSIRSVAGVNVDLTLPAEGSSQSFEANSLIKVLP